ncbi:MAG TPA: PAS domain S-box protein [Longimicrobium sp.]|nr:PAS domain S-box protein [Longimicrobium sp.]
MTPVHDPALVVVSIAIAFAASYTALVLAARVAALHGRTRRRWLWGGALAMGVGIWSMHFVAMLAFRLPVPIAHAPGAVALSMAAAVGASLLALTVASRPTLGRGRIAAAGVAMGGAIAGMHYIGMAGMRMAADVRYDPALVGLSVALAMGASWLALGLGFVAPEGSAERMVGRRRAAAAILGGAVAAMHYTGMFAARFVPTRAPAGVEAPGGLGMSPLAAAVALSTLAILLLAIFAARSDRRARARATTILERITDGFLAIDSAGCCIYANPAAETLLGHPPGGMLGAPLEELVPEGDPLVEASRRALRQQSFEEMEEHFPALGRWLELRLYPSPDSVTMYLRDVTERNASDAALRRREQQLAEAQRIAAVGSWEWVVGAESAEWSGEMYRIYGMEPDGAGAPHAALTGLAHPDDRAASERVIQRALRTGAPFSFEMRIVPVHGEPRHLQFRGVVVRGADGSPARLTGTCQDITERKEAERRVQQLNRTLDAVIDASPLAVIAVNLRREVTLWNPAAERTFGWTRAEVLGGPNPIVPPGETSMFERLVSDPAGSREPTFREAVRQRKDGALRHVSISAAALHDAAGAITGAVALISDITEKRAAAEALRASEERFRTVVESVGEGLLITDLEDRVLYANSRVSEITGHAPEALVGRVAYEVFDSPSAAEMKRRLTARSHGVSERYEVSVRRADGSRVWIEVIGTPFRNPAGEVVGTLGAITDVTERKEAADALRESEAQLRQAHKMEAVGRLAGGIAHDFNNLLTAILGNAELLLADVEPGSPIRADLEEITAAGQRAAALTRQLLAFSRQQVLHPRVLDANSVFAEMERMLRRVIGEHIDFAVDLAPDLGLVRADPGQLEQVLLNLVVNARDAMPDGGTLRVRSRNVMVDLHSTHPLPADINPGPYAVFSVADTGSGMDDETQQRIFEPFFTTKEQGKGTGLGLATVYGIVNQSGGYIGVSSAPGAGTTFEVYLPVVAADVGSAAAARDEWAPGGGETVLVVEDEDMVRSLACRVLRRKGYTVLEADRGEAALRLMDSHRGPIHLVLTDMVMPGMSGRALAGRIVLRRPGTRILFTSGYTPDMYASSGALEPDTHFLAKPFEPGDLARMVRELLDSGDAAT